jgi:hypothetical protein
MASSYATSTPKSSDIGSVRRNTRKIVSLDVSIDPLDPYDDADDLAEYQITVNGRIIKRMNRYQAARLLGETK